MEVTKSQFTHENTKDGEEHIGRQTEDFGRLEYSGTSVISTASVSMTYKITNIQKLSQWKALEHDNKEKCSGQIRVIPLTEDINWRLFWPYW